jgi:hypothetical protein
MSATRRVGSSTTTSNAPKRIAKSHLFVLRPATPWTLTARASGQIESRRTPKLSRSDNSKAPDTPLAPFGMPTRITRWDSSTAVASATITGALTIRNPAAHAHAASAARRRPRDGATARSHHAITGSTGRPLAVGAPIASTTPVATAPAGPHHTRVLAANATSANGRPGRYQPCHGAKPEYARLAAGSSA